jgi:hypothetical protein
MKDLIIANLIAFGVLAVYVIYIVLTINKITKNDKS